MNYKKCMIIVISMILSIDQSHTMFSSTTKKALPAITAAGGIGISAFGVGKGQDDRIMPVDLSDQVATDPMIAPIYKVKAPSVNPSRQYQSTLKRAIVPQLAAADGDVEKRSTHSIKKVSDIFTRPLDGWVDSFKTSDGYKVAAGTAERLRQSTTDLISQFDLDRSDFNLQEEPLIEGLTWLQLKSDAQRVVYLRNSLKDFTLADDVSLHFVARLLSCLPENAFNDYIAMVKNKAQIKKSIKVITSNNVMNSFIEITTSPSEDIIKSTYPSDVAFHEAGHALIGALVFKTTVFSFGQASSISVGCAPLNRFEGICENYSNYETLSHLSDQNYSMLLDELQEDTQNIIMMGLSGGIGMLIKENIKKMSFQKFKELSDYYGMGDRTLQSSDLYGAYQLAERFVRYKDLNIISKDQLIPEIDPVEFERQVEDFLEASFEKAWKLMNKEENKVKLDRMADALIKNDGVIYMDQIYAVAGVQRPPFDFEMTLREKMQRDVFNWLSWTSKRMREYEKLHPDFL